MRFQSLMVAVSVLLVSACSLIEGAQQNVTINSNPQGAVVKIDERSFATPATIPLLKGTSEYYFTVEKPGYKPVSGKVDKNFRVWYSVDNTVTLEALPVPPAAAVQAIPGGYPAQGIQVQASPPLQAMPAPMPLLQPLPGAAMGAQPVPAPEPASPIPAVR